MSERPENDLYCARYEHFGALGVVKEDLHKHLMTREEAVALLRTTADSIEQHFEAIGPGDKVVLTLTRGDQHPERWN